MKNDVSMNQSGYMADEFEGRSSLGMTLRQLNAQMSQRSQNRSKTGIDLKSLSRLNTVDASYMNNDNEAIDTPRYTPESYRKEIAKDSNKRAQFFESKKEIDQSPPQDILLTPNNKMDSKHKEMRLER
jgi:hypothetical protein